MPKRKRDLFTPHEIHKAVLETQSTKPAVVAGALSCESETLNSLLILIDTTCEKLLQLDEKTAASLFKERYEEKIDAESRLLNMTVYELQQKIKACTWRIELTNYILVSDYRLLTTLKSLGTSYDELNSLSENEAQIKFGHRFHKTINELLQIKEPGVRQSALSRPAKKKRRFDNEFVFAEPALAEASRAQETLPMPNTLGQSPLFVLEPPPVIINTKQENSVHETITESASDSYPEPEILPLDTHAEIKKTRPSKHRHHRHHLTENISYVISSRGKKVKIYYSKEMTANKAAELISGRIRTRPDCYQYVTVKKEEGTISIVMVKHAVFPQGVTFKTVMKSLKEDRRSHVKWDWHTLSTRNTNESNKVIVESHGNYTVRTIAVQLRKLIRKDSEDINKQLTIKQNKNENSVTVLLKSEQCLSSGLSLRSYLEILMHKDILDDFLCTVESGFLYSIENAWRDNHTLHFLIKSMDADYSKSLLKKILALAGDADQFIFDYLSWLDNENLMLEVLQEIHLEWGAGGDQPESVKLQVRLLQESLYQLSDRPSLLAGEEGMSLFDLMQNDNGAEHLEQSEKGAEFAAPHSPSLTLFGHSYLLQTETNSFPMQFPNSDRAEAASVSSLHATLFNDRQLAKPPTNNNEQHDDNKRIYK